MNKIKKIATLCLITFLLGSCSTTNMIENTRKPQSLDELVLALPQITKEIENPAIFNEVTCDTYLGEIIDYGYNLPSSYFYPKSESEVAALFNEGQLYYKEIVNIQNKSLNKFKEFSY